MVVFDAALALFLFSNHVGAPIDQATGKPVDRPKDRVDFLLETLQSAKTKIIIPTPALAEILVRAGKAGPAYLAKLQTSGAIKIEPFDTRAAIQVAWMASQPGDRPRNTGEVYAKIKYDRQIAAIAKVCGATTIYSDDGNVRSYAKRMQITAYGIAELPLPPEPDQPDLLDMFAIQPDTAISDEQELDKLNETAEIDLFELNELDGAPDSSADGGKDEEPGQPEGPVGTVPPSRT